MNMIYAKLKCKQIFIVVKIWICKHKGMEQGYGIEDLISNWFGTNWR